MVVINWSLNAYTRSARHAYGEFGVALVRRRAAMGGLTQVPPRPDGGGSVADSEQDGIRSPKSTASGGGECRR